MAETTNCIFIEGLEVKASVGIYEHEKKGAQSLIISLNAKCLKNAHFYSDDINDTINYENIVKIIHDAIDKQHYSLIETLAETIATDILLIQGIYGITIEIRKPSVLGADSKGILGIKIKREA